jgi:hypothetical protein
MANWSTFFRKALRIVVLAATIMVAFLTLVLLIAYGLAWLQGGSANLLLAILCSLIAWLFLLVFHIKNETITVPVKNLPSFLSWCRLVLKDLGYEVSETSSEHLVSRPSFRALLFGGRINVQTHENEGRITGPKVFVEILRRRLRLQSHLAYAGQLLRDSRTGPGERLLKRVQLSLRVTPDQWNQIGQGVVRKLASEGAQVVCEIHLMAQSDKGIREALVEGPVRQCLNREHIHVEVHKDRARWEDPRGHTAQATAADTEGCKELNGAKV